MGKQRNHRIAVSGSAYRGSNPWGATILESATYFKKIPLKNLTGTGRKVLIRRTRAHRGMAHFTAHLRQVHSPETLELCCCQVPPFAAN